jgi:hypothetical protein
MPYFFIEKYLNPTLHLYGMFKTKCKECNKVIEGYTANHVKYQLSQHRLSKRHIKKVALLKSIKKQEVKQNG